MEVNLDIDHRESYLIEALRSLKVEFSTCNLDVGDILLKYNDRVICIIERKTLSDLDQSIKDGRYKDQKQRMFNNYERNTVMYIIEGDAFIEPNTSYKTKYQVSYERLQGSIINMMIRDNIKVMCVENVIATAKFIAEMYYRVSKDPIKYINTNNMDNNIMHAITSIKHTRNSCITPATFPESALSLIPGVSPSIAGKVFELYGTLQNMIKLCNEKEIADIKTQSGRRIGNKVAKRIVEFIRFEKNETT